MPEHQHNDPEVVEVAQKYLTPHNRAGESDLPGPLTSRTAYDIKEMHAALPNLADDVLRRIPILEPGTRLQEGATYFNLRHPERGEFTGMNNMTVSDQDWIIAKEYIDFELWNQLTGEQNQYRLGRFAEEGPQIRT
ncbi:MAG TPA: hypothetical protein VFB38_07010 [Chthonomonadaceae bacterium]|nr:hypothetical protein [Chthonomonadaceae bacterium]